MVGFLFGGNTGLTYQDLQDRRAAADALAKRIMGSQPRNVPEGIGAMLMGVAAGVGRHGADKGIKEGRTAASEQFNKLFGQITGQPVPDNQSPGSLLPSPGVASELASTDPAPDASSNGSTFSPFIDTVRQNGLTNPYGLAAVAATGKAESGWSPKNANRSWSDPSESGQAGMAGGVMSWRADRLANLQKYAASKGEQGNGSPETQAEFFMREDPDLIAKLNAAKSPEEAQSLMNNAWKFAGYNRPGGEAARRMSLANAYAPQFSGAGNQVASLDPSAGMPAAAAIEQQASGSRYVDPMVSAPTNQPAPPMQQPAAPFDAGRFGDPIKPAEMPPAQDDLQARLGAQANAFATAPQQAAGALPPLPTREVGSTPQGAGVPPQVPQQVAQATPPGMPQIQPYRPNPQLLQLLSNPFLDDNQKGVLQIMMRQEMEQHELAQQQQIWQARQQFEQQQRQSDPAYQLGLKQTQAEIDRMSQPGYRMLTADERKAFGIPEYDTRPYQVSREGQISAVGGMGQAQSAGIEASQREALAQRYGIDPNSAEGQRFILTGSLPSSDKGVTAGDREAIRDADDMVNSGEATLGLIDRAMSLSDKAYEGAGAGTRALIASQWGDEGALATREFDNIITEQALGQLKSIFGAAPTEGERAILLEVQGSSSQPKAVRDEILKRARRAVERRVNYNRDRANELRGGTYYKPRSAEPNVQTNTPRTAEEATGLPPVDRPAAPQGRNVARPQTDAEFNALPSGALYVDPDDNQTYRKP